jgi:hypothetical protein
MMTTTPTRTILRRGIIRLLFLVPSFSVLAFTSNHLQGVRTSHGSFVSATTMDGDTGDTTKVSSEQQEIIPLEVDIAIVGAGLGGLCAGAILNTLYNKRVAVFESHYIAGGCAHAFDRKASNGETFTFDSGPTILLGCVFII